MARREDKELREYRELMQVPERFEDGFTYRTVIGALFIGFLMMPGSIYMMLVAGQSLGPAAQWVTIILFVEVARHSFTRLRPQEIYILYVMAGGIVAAPFSGLLWNQYLVQSEAARGFGLTDQIPHWVAPPTASEALAERTFFHRDWLAAIGLLVLRMALSRIDSFGLGYVLFRITSDLERLPFPMAPVGAMGALALSESTEEKQGWRWRCFSLGSMIGLGFGVIYVGVPVFTGAAFSRPVEILPIPFLDLTQATEDWLPAVSTGITFDLGSLFVGMVLPFWAVVGGLVGFIITAIANPLLHWQGVLHTWRPGMDTIQTRIANYTDLYLSVGIGLALAIAAIGIYSVVRRLVEAARDRRTQVSLKPPTQRGDFSLWIGIGIYLFSTTCYILLCLWLVPGFHLIFFIAFGFLYTPLISYITARMEGMAGQYVEIPFVREAAFILSGTRGAAIWFAPIPIANYGMQVVSFRQLELTGTKIKSLIKLTILQFPIVLVAGVLVSQMIWRLAPIPSETYPFTAKIWHLQAFQQLLMVTATTEGYSPYLESLRFEYIGAAFAGGLVIYTFLAAFGLPTLLIYGIVRGMGDTLPHYVVVEFIGAMIGRFYFYKRFGAQWRQYVPVLLAGFSCGMGLIGMMALALALVAKAVERVAY